MSKVLRTIITAACLTATASVFADTTVNMAMTAPTGSTGASAGTVVIKETKYGLLFTPNITGAKEGLRGFHVHVKADCGDNGMAAGGHFDPKNTSKHLGPFNDSGHLGDLPAVYVNANGSVTLPVLAPKLKHIAQIKNHALMLHAGGDNYSDTPELLGGGDGRMICGVIK